MSATGLPSTSTPTPVNRVRLTLAINGAEYVVRPLALAEVPPGAVRGFRLARDDRRRGKVAYIIAGGAEGFTCSCPDHRFRRSHGWACKHLAAATACGLL